MIGKYILLSVFFIAVLLTGCATVTTKTAEPEPPPPAEENEPDNGLGDHPDWLLNPPVEAGAFFGIGTDKDLTTAKQLSIVNAGQQFSVEVSSVLSEYNAGTNENEKTVVSMMEKQVTSQVVYGAKFIDQYQDPQGRYWILTKAPMECILDATETVLLSYNLAITRNKKVVQEIVRKIEEKVAVKTEYYEEEPEIEEPPVIVEKEEPEEPPEPVKPKKEEPKKEDILYGSLLGVNIGYDFDNEFFSTMSIISVGYRIGSIGFLFQTSLFEGVLEGSWFTTEEYVLLPVIIEFSPFQFFNPTNFFPFVFFKTWIIDSISIGEFLFETGIAIRWTPIEVVFPMTLAAGYRSYLQSFYISVNFDVGLYLPW